ncbi:centromere protein S-like [Chrysoperla carnea]|uniref:centromere protein S-like n=1 Tax=Chrysoperla carnea TaxID=189513 RepID=UPI001D05F2F4|nr:centromere protein S-like [Chrysoperla carnea]
MMKNASNKEKLRVKILLETQKLTKEIGENLNMTIDDRANELISELIWKKLNLYGSDLECFAKHAKRSLITPDDIKVLVRRNVGLKEHIVDKVENVKSNKVKKKKEDKSPAAP